MPSEIGIQFYPIWQECRDSGSDPESILPSLLPTLKSHGLQSWEHSADNLEDFLRVHRQLTAHGITTKSVYIGGPMHTENWLHTVNQIEAAALSVKRLGVEIIVHNPDPTSWATKDPKSDAQLQTQSKALQLAAEKVRQAGLRFAYHWHDAEFFCGARELWHTLLNTDPALLEICFDSHWTYRGAGNSQVALFDLLEFTLPRIATFHLRQSIGGTWSESFTEQGDIDYKRFFATLKKRHWSGLIVLEQALEAATPRTLPLAEAQAQSVAALKRALSA